LRKITASLLLFFIFFAWRLVGLLVKTVDFSNHYCIWQFNSKMFFKKRAQLEYFAPSVHGCNSI